MGGAAAAAVSHQSAHGACPVKRSLCCFALWAITALSALAALGEQAWKAMDQADERIQARGREVLEHAGTRLVGQ